MASTYSNLKIELIATGEQDGTWGITTNTNLGTAIEEAVVGRANAVFATDADLTIALTDTNATQVARHYILNVTSSGALSTTRNLIVPSIDKPYIIENNTSGDQNIIVKTSAGTGVTVPNGKKVMVYADSTNVVQAFDYASTMQVGSLTTTTAIPVSSGGTGTTTLTANNVLLGNGTSAPLTVAPGTSGNLLTSNGTTWVSSAPPEGVPSGMVLYVAANTAPTGYLKANGAQVSRSTYAALFAAIGTTFGVGDGSTTFTLPDLRGEFIRGWDDGRGIDSGRAFGSAQADAFESHTHSLAATTSRFGSTQSTAAGYSRDAQAAGYTPPDTLSTGGTETRPRNIALLACIKF